MKARMPRRPWRCDCNPFWSSAPFSVPPGRGRRQPRQPPPRGHTTADAVATPTPRRLTSWSGATKIFAGFLAVSCSESSSIHCGPVSDAVQWCLDVRKFRFIRIYRRNRCFKQSRPCNKKGICPPILCRGIPPYIYIYIYIWVLSEILPPRNSPFRAAFAKLPRSFAHEEKQHLNITQAQKHL